MRRPLNGGSVDRRPGAVAGAGTPDVAVPPDVAVSPGAAAPDGSGGPRTGIVASGRLAASKRGERASVTADHGGPGEPPSAPAGQRRALLRLGVVVAVIVALAIVAHQTALLIVVSAIILMVMLHELGHFLTAKWSHMKVTEFFLGFGPRLWSVRRGETEYGIKAIPAGGYVKIVGMSSLEEVDPADEARTYRQQPFHNRLMVAVAGSFMHFLTALLMLWGLLVFIGVPRADAVSIVGLAPVAHGVDPARAAGLRAGDVIVQVDGRPVSSESALVQVIGSHAGRPVRLTIERGGKRRAVVVTPAAVTVPATSGSGANGATVTKGRIGVQVGQGPLATMGPLAGVRVAGVDFGRVVSSSMSALGSTFSLHGLTSFFSQLGSSKRAAQAAQNGTRPESIYGVVRTATQGAQAGPLYLIEVLVSIDVFIGIANLFPMLPLDGGHVLVAVYERLRSRRGRRYVADVTKLMPVAYAFVLFLLVFVGSAVFLDITHPVVNPFQ